MPNQKTGTKKTNSEPDCHRISVYCKRLDRALDKLARNNTLLFTSKFKDTTTVTVIRYSLPLIQRVKFIDENNHKSRVAKSGDSRYIPINYGKVGSKGCNGICWTLTSRFFQGCISSTKYSDDHLYGYPRFEEFRLADFADDRGVERKVISNVLLVNAGIFIEDLNPRLEYQWSLQYKEDIDSIPQLLVNPRNSAERQAQIFKDHFNIDVKTDRESVVIKQLPNNN